MFTWEGRRYQRTIESISCIETYFRICKKTNKRIAVEFKSTLCSTKPHTDGCSIQVCGHTKANLRVLTGLTRLYQSPSLSPPLPTGWCCNYSKPIEKQTELICIVLMLRHRGDGDIIRCHSLLFCIGQILKDTAIKRGSRERSIDSARYSCTGSNRYPITIIPGRPIVVCWAIFHFIVSFAYQSVGLQTLFSE